MTPAHRSTAADAIFGDLARSDMREARTCKRDDCSQNAIGRARVDGTIQPLCTAHLAAACGVSEAAVQRASGKGFKRGESA